MVHQSMMKDIYIKKIRMHDNKIYTNVRGLNVPEDDIEWQYFTVISINSLLVYENKYYYYIINITVIFRQLCL